MIEIETPQLTIIERREEGLKLADVLKGKHPRKVGVPGFRKTVGPEIDTLDVFFEEIDNPDLSFDKKHVVATARDGKTNFLIRDNKILMHCPQKIIFDSDERTYNCEQLFAGTHDPENGYSLHHFNEKGQQTTVLENQHEIRQIFIYSDNYLFASSKENETTLTLINIESGKIVKQFTLNKAVDLKNIHYAKTNDKMANFWWYIDENETDYYENSDKSLYFNEILEAEHVITYDHSQNLQHSLTVTRRKDDNGVEIRRDGKIIRTTEKHYGTWYAFGYIRANADLTVAVIPLVDEKGRHVFCITPEREGIYGPVDDDSSLDFNVVDNVIVGNFKDHGVNRSVVITPKVLEKAETDEKSANTDLAKEDTTYP